MSCQMQCLILIRIIGLLKNSYIICAAFVKICVLIRIHRIYLKADYLEIFPGNLTGLSDIFYIGFGFALTGKDQDLLKSGFCNGCHFFFDLICIQLCTADFVMTVKSAVNAVVLTVVCNIDRCKHADTVSKMLPCLDPCSLCDFFQKWKCCR